MNTANKITFSVQNRLKTFRRHVLRVLFFDSIIVFIGFWNGLLTSEDRSIKVLSLFIIFLSVIHSIFVFRKAYKINLISIEVLDDSYLLSYSKWFTKTSFLKVDDRNIKMNIEKIDPKSGTIAYSEIKFIGDRTEITFKVPLTDLKDILLFCSENKSLNLSTNDVWDINEISTYLDFEESRSVTKKKQRDS